MEQLILIFHFVVAVALIGLILIQQGKGAEAGPLLVQVLLKPFLVVLGVGTSLVKQPRF